MESLEQKTEDYFKVEGNDLVPIYGFFRYNSRVKKIYNKDLRRVCEGKFKLKELREEMRSLDSTRHKIEMRRLGLYLFNAACFVSGLYGVLELVN